VSALLKRTLEAHLQSLRGQLTDTNAAHLDRELVQSRAFLHTTKDAGWARQLRQRIQQLEAQKRRGVDQKELQRRVDAVEALYKLIRDHPAYNKTRAKRTRRAVRTD